jgi:hypothetical protein
MGRLAAMSTLQASAVRPTIPARHGGQRYFDGCNDFMILDRISAIDADRSDGRADFVS